MTTADNGFKQKISNLFECKTCDYITCRKSNYETHMLSTKHKKRVQMTTLDNDFKQPLSKKYVCNICEKEFNDRAGIWRHKKKCKSEDNQIDVGTLDMNLIMQLLKQKRARVWRKSSQLPLVL